MNKQELLRKIPQIDEVLQDERLSSVFAQMPRELVLSAAREIVDELREKILHEAADAELLGAIDAIVNRVIKKANEKNQLSLRRLINGTGVVLHTNLGRAKLSEEAVRQVQNIAEQYSNLEYDEQHGQRGSRHDHIEAIITKVTGAEAAMVVNNNAAATMLCLSAIAKDKGVVVSRGELVEIGGSFRIPDIMAESGAILVEVGTTNKTKIEDYKKAIETESIGALMKVHTSNYKIVGFTAEASLEELVALGKESDIPVIYDMGSGLILSLKQYGIHEPTVTESMKIGVDLMLFSGDKLLGGPQAGILIGKKKYIQIMKKHPLARVLRIDKMTLAALESTFRLYLDPSSVIEKIPTLHMISESKDTLRKKAEVLQEKINENTQIYATEIIESSGQVGGGSVPTALLPGFAVAISTNQMSAQKLERACRRNETPIVVRIMDDKVCVDVRTVDEEELDLIAAAMVHIEQALGGVEHE